MNIMKKIFLIIFLAAAVTACRKDGSGSSKGKTLLSKVFVGDLLTYEFIYNLDGKVTRINHYNTGTGTSILLTYHLYQYNSDGRMSEKLQYAADHKPLRRHVFAYSDQGRLTRVDEATVADGEGDLDIMDYYYTYGYNEKGQLQTMHNYRSNNAYLNHKKFIYDNQGLWQGWEYYIFEDLDFQLKEKIEFWPGGKPIPDHWKHILVVPSDFNLFRLFIPGYEITSYWTGPAGSVLTYAFENREYNNQGFVTKEILKVITASSTAETERRYEYVP